MIIELGKLADVTKNFGSHGSLDDSGYKNIG